MQNLGRMPVGFINLHFENLSVPAGSCDEFFNES